MQSLHAYARSNSNTIVFLTILCRSPHPELAAEPAFQPRATAKTLKTLTLGLLSLKHRPLSNPSGEQNDLTQHHINQAVNACTCLRRCLFPVEPLCGRPGRRSE